MSHKRKQQGNVLVFSLAIILIFGVLGASMVSLQWGNSDILAREMLSRQANFYARSGKEWALTQLFPLRLDTSQQPDATTLRARCVAINNSNNSSAQSAMNTMMTGHLGCTFITTNDVCTAPDASLPIDLQHFRIQTTIQCGSNHLVVQRTREVWVRAVN